MLPVCAGLRKNMLESIASQPAGEWLLAIATSGRRGSVALFRGGQLQREMMLAEETRHAQLLLPAISACLAGAGLAASDLAAIAVDIGPGSYTGTRIGVMAACCLAYATGCRLAAISGLAALAWEARQTAPIIMVVQDARRDEVYAAVYEVEGEMMRPVVADCALIPDEAASLPLSLIHI